MINIDGFKNVTALVIGDLMIDEYLWGNRWDHQ
jgi:bifunctional ADP-heptose synthase (sugar kinase/adenylyltransferase)